MANDIHIPEWLQRLWLTRIAQSFRAINEERLEGKLRTPQFELLRGGKQAGSWDPRTRTIGIGIDHIVAATDWTAVIVTLRHEMAHQVVDELWQTAHARPHGPLFERACGLLGLDEEGSARTIIYRAEERRVLTRISKLLSLARSSNEHEAELAMAMASRMLLKHNLSVADLESKPGYLARRLGPVFARIPLEHKQVSNILSQHFFVRCIWLSSYVPATNREGLVLEVLGWPHSVALAEHIHGYLLASLDRLWEQHLAESGLQRGTVRARNSFRTGVLVAVSDRLRVETRAHQEQGLVWLGDPGLREFFERRYPQRRTLGRGRISDPQGFEAGRRAGADLALRPALDDAPAVQRGRLLAERR